MKRSENLWYYCILACQISSYSILFSVKLALCCLFTNTDDKGVICPTLRRHQAQSAHTHTVLIGGLISQIESVWVYHGCTDPKSVHTYIQF